MQKIDLLPCPFCGKQDTAKITTVAECNYLDDPTEWDKTHYGAVCSLAVGGCGASTGWYYETQEEAAKAWNTRASGWIPCSKRMPEDDEEVLFAVTYPWDKGKKPNVKLGRHHGKNEKGRWTVYYGAFLDYEVTHWMPLPEPPKAEVKA